MTSLLKGAFASGAWRELVSDRGAGFVVSKAKLLENRYHDLRGGGACFLQRNALGKPKSIAQRAFNAGIAAGRFIRVHSSQGVSLHCMSPFVWVMLSDEAYVVGLRLDTRKKVDFRVRPSAGRPASPGQNGETCAHD